MNNNNLFLGILSNILKSLKTEVDVIFFGRLFQVFVTKYRKEFKPYVVVDTLGASLIKYFSFIKC